MSQQEIDAQAMPVNDASGFALFGMFKNGVGNHQTFYQVDQMTLALRQSPHMNDVRAQIQQNLAAGDYSDQGHDYGSTALDYDVPNGLAGHLQQGLDAFSMFKGAVDRDHMVKTDASMIGSYDVSYQVVAVDPASGKAIVAFHGQNVWDRKSMTRNPDTPKDQVSNKGPTTGPYSPQTQDFYWVETIDFPVKRNRRGGRRAGPDSPGRPARPGSLGRRRSGTTVVRPSCGE